MKALTQEVVAKIAASAKVPRANHQLLLIYIMNELNLFSVISNFKPTAAHFLPKSPAERQSLKRFAEKTKELQRCFSELRPLAKKYVLAERDDDFKDKDITWENVLGRPVVAAVDQKGSAEQEIKNQIEALVRGAEAALARYSFKPRRRKGPPPGPTKKNLGLYFVIRVSRKN